MISNSQQLLAMQMQLAEALTENAALKMATVAAENVDLKATIEQGKVKSLSDQNFRALIRRRADKLAAAGTGYEALVLLKSIGE